MFYKALQFCVSILPTPLGQIVVFFLVFFGVLVVFKLIKVVLEAVPFV